MYDPFTFCGHHLCVDSLDQEAVSVWKYDRKYICVRMIYFLYYSSLFGFFHFFVCLFVLCFVLFLTGNPITRRMAHTSDIRRPTYVIMITLDAWGPVYQHGSTLTSAWMSNHIHYKVWDEIIYSFQNINDETAEVWECINNFIPQFIVGVIPYLCSYWS